MPLKEASESEWIANSVLRRDDDSCSRHQGQEQLQSGNVEAKGRDGQQPVARSHRRERPHRFEKIGERAAIDPDPLRHSCRAGRVENIGKLPGMGRRHRFGCGRIRLRRQQIIHRPVNH